MTWYRGCAESELALRMGWTLVHFLWQGGVVALGCLLAWRGLRKHSSNARYMAGCGALALLAVCPLFTFLSVTPSGAIPAIPGIASLGQPPAREDVSAPALSGTKAEPVRAPPSRSVSSATPDTSRTFSARPPLSSLLPLAVLCWLTGVCALSLRLLGGWWHVARLRRHFVRPLEGAVRTRFDALAERMGIRAPVRLLESALAANAMVIGWLRPVVLVPAAAVAGLPAEQFEGILLHELAHIRRHDFLVNVLQTFLETLLFYHPAVWWISRRVRIEREYCCDDLAVCISGTRCAMRAR